MDDAKPSLARRAIAAVVLLVAAIIAIRIAVGFISAIFWIAALVVLAGASLWAVTTLRSGKREREVKQSPAAALPATPEDRVEAQMREIQEQLRRQGRG